jgi:uncharacterized membrane protein YdfJ with MMPL/SSD domain
MGRALAALTEQRSGAVIGVFAALLVVAAIYGAGVADRLQVVDFEAIGSDSTVARALMEERLGIGEPQVVALFEDVGGGDAARRKAALGALLARAAADPGVAQVEAPGDVPGLVSRDGTQALALLHLRGGDEAQRATFARVAETLRDGPFPVRFGGALPATLYAQDLAGRDVERAELICFPLVAVLLLLFFRGLVAASLPLVVAGFGIPASLALVRGLTEFTDVSVFALNVASFLGIGLAVDYALLLVSRFRAELAAGASVGEANARTIATAGRAVFVSALTVSTSLLALLAFPVVILRTIALAGALVVLCAAAAAVALLPALMCVLARRRGRLSLRAPERPERDARWWRALALAVMRRPLPVALGVLLLLLAMGVPARRLAPMVPDARSFPAAAEVRRVQEALDTGFDGAELAPLYVVVQSREPIERPESLRAVTGLVHRLAALPGVRRVESPFATPPLDDPARAAALLAHRDAWPEAERRAFDAVVRDDLTLLRVIPASGDDSAANRALIRRVRALESGDLEVRVGGPAVRDADAKAAVTRHLEPAIALLVGINLVVLFLSFGSVVVPVKAAGMAALSLAASFGALVLIFQDGHLHRLLGFEPQTGIDLAVLVVMFAVVFGLSMDYEIFLLSRIREEYDRTGDNRASVAVGLERTGSIITRAAVLLIAVLGAFALGDLIFVKEIGVAMAVAIAVDASIVRALLVPATMELLGAANWWAPAPLHRLWRRIGLRPSEG